MRLPRLPLSVRLPKLPFTQLPKASLRLGRLLLPSGPWRVLAVVVGLAVWVGFLDKYDLYTQFRLEQRKAELEAEQTYYQTAIEQLEARRLELSLNRAAKERLAREGYWMKREHEHLYVVVSEAEQLP